MTTETARGPHAPAFFLAHATPMLPLSDPSPYTEALRSASREFAPPKAIVIVSAYGISDETVQVSISDQPGIHYDFKGFPGELYQLEYPCPGSREVGVRVASLLTEAGFTVELDSSRRLDHGVWMPLSFLRPEARTPVIQVSLPVGLGARHALKMGKALQSLRGEGVWLIGSGGVVHNLAELKWYLRDAEAPAWAVGFERWVKDQLRAKDVESLVDFENEGPEAKLAQPEPKHFFPLLFTVGSAWVGDEARTLCEGIQYQSVSLFSFAMTGPERLN